MTKKEAEKLYIGDWVENKKTGEGFDVYGISKQNDNIFIIDKNGLCHPYRTLNYIFREEIEYYNYVLGYNFTRKQWLFDAKTYLDPDDWCWKWNRNHKYARELTRREISIMRTIAKENPDKKYVIPELRSKNVEPQESEETDADNN